MGLGWFFVVVKFKDRFKPINCLQAREVESTVEGRGERDMTEL